MICDNLWHNSEMLSSFLEESRIVFKAQGQKNDLDLLRGHIYKELILCEYDDFLFYYSTKAFS